MISAMKAVIWHYFLEGVVSIPTHLGSDKQPAMLPRLVLLPTLSAFPTSLVDKDVCLMAFSSHHSAVATRCANGSTCSGQHAALRCCQSSLLPACLYHGYTLGSVCPILDNWPSKQAYNNMCVGFFSVVSLIFSHLYGWCFSRFAKTRTKFLLKTNTNRQQIISGLWKKHHVLPLPSHNTLHTSPFCIPESFFSSSLSHLQLCLNRKVSE